MKLGVSEDLIKAIAFSQSPVKKSKVSEDAFQPVKDDAPTSPDAPEAPEPVTPVASEPLAAAISAPPSDSGSSELINLSAPPRSETPKQLQVVDTQRVMKLLRQATNSRFHHFVVGADGSKASKVAFNTALTLRKAKGKFYVLHIEDTSKNSYLPSDMKWPAIREEAEVSLATSVPMSFYSMESIVKDPGESTKAKFVGRINEIDSPMFVCLGWVGRKGPKDDPTVLGSVSNVCMRTCNHPVMVCKKVPDKGSHSYAVCVDGGKRGIQAFDAVMALSKSIDTVSVLYCYNDEEVRKTIQEQFEINFEGNGYDPEKIKFVPVLKEAGVPVHKCLTDHINEVREQSKSTILTTITTNKLSLVTSLLASCFARPTPLDWLYLRSHCT